jgi:SAM-dependent methyltransferase
MKNPWLDIPLADYEGHMALPYVAQAKLLSDVFADALKIFSPQSVAVLGCAGGNGFDRISSQITKRVVGIDINPEYIHDTRKRFNDRLPALELFAGDIQTDAFDFLPVDLVFGSLLFEYVDVDVVLVNIRSMLTASGKMVTVVQLPNTGIPEVTPSPFTSMRALSSAMRLVPPEILERLAAVQGFELIGSRVVESAGGKLFQVQTFCQTTPDQDM